MPSDGTRVVMTGVGMATPFPRLMRLRRDQATLHACSLTPFCTASSFLGTPVDGG
jgi:hypothetical protein